MMRTLLKYFIFSGVILLFSCKKKALGPQKTGGDNTSNEKAKEESPVSGNGVYIINEGNFNYGNSSVSRFDPESGKTQQDQFQEVNSRALGDVAQSMTINNDKGYIVVNNSAKIEVVDLKSLSAIATINGFNSPRYMEVVSSEKAYVTDLYADKVYVVNLSTNKISGEIPVPGWTEKILQFDDKVFVCGTENDKIYEIDVKNDVLTDSIGVGVEPNSLVLDKNNNIWVLSSGGINEAYPKLELLNPKTGKIEKTFTFSSKNMSPGNLIINDNRDEIFFLNDDVYKMNIQSNSLPGTPFIPSSSALFYSLGGDFNRDELYVSDAVDYVQQGMLYRYNSSGLPIDTIKTGIIPGEIIPYEY